ncbi:MAG: hypothetical protein Q4C03_06995 [bacterium]|nr:hypothetical protein [bacterium]
MFDRFILFPWGGLNHTGEEAREELKGIAECGFNASCFVTSAEYDICRDLGLMIYSLLSDGVTFHDDAYTTVQQLIAKETDGKWFGKEFDESEVRSAMHERLKNLPRDVVSVYLNDEPGTSLYPGLAVLTDCVHKEAPGVEPYINLFPNYAVCGAPNLSQLEAETYEEYLERFASEVRPDSISLDNYKVFVSSDFSVPGSQESYFLNLIQAQNVCKKHNLPFQHVICCNQLRHWQTPPSPANLAFQAYTSLAAGAKVISWFLYFGRGGYLMAPVDDNTGENVRTPTWYLLREINRQILPLGEALFPMTFESMYFTHPDGIGGAKSVNECPALHGFESDTPCMIGHFRDTDGADVLVIVNASLEKSTRIAPNVDGEILEYSADRGGFVKPILVNRRGNSSPMWLTAGMGTVLKIAKA